MNYPADRVFVAGHRPRVTCVTKPPFSPLPETRINFHTCRDDRAPFRVCEIPPRYEGEVRLMLSRFEFAEPAISSPAFREKMVKVCFVVCPR